MRRLRYMVMLLLLVGVMLPMVSYAFDLSKSFSFGISLGGAGGGASPANGDLVGWKDNGQPIKCDSLEEVKSGVLIGKMVPCIVRTVERATQQFTTKMVEWLRPLLYAFLTLVIVLFGVRVASGEQDMHKQGILLLIKITLVLSILNILPGQLVPATYTIMNQTQEIVLGAVDSSNISCNVNDFGAPKTLPVWALMDCISGKLFGFMVGNDGSPNMVLTSSLLGMLTGFLFGGTWGLVIFFGMVGVLISIFMLIVRVVAAFLNGYLIACIMLIISPLLMPLVFMKSTSTYFEGVWKNLLTAFVMPIIVTAYSLLALMIYDRMLFAPTSLLNTIFDEAKMAGALLPDRQACSRVLNSDIANRAEPKDTNFGAKLKNRFLYNLIPTQSGGNEPCAILKVPNLDIKEIGDDRFKQGKGTINSIFLNLASLFVLGFLANKGLKSIVGLTRQLTPAGAVATSMNPVGQAEQLVQQGIHNAKTSMGNAYSDGKNGKSTDASGADFIQRTPAAMKAGLESFYSTIKRE